MYLQRNIETRSWIHCCRGKAKTLTYYENVFVALISQHAKHIHHIILSSLQCLILTYFSTLFHRQQDFFEKGIEKKLFSFSL
jgi:hypothetical protein